MMESLLYYEVDPSDMSKVMANNIIYALKEEPPTFASADMLTASARWLNGSALCDRLGLKQVSLAYDEAIEGMAGVIAAARVCQVGSGRSGRG